MIMSWRVLFMTGFEAAVLFFSLFGSPDPGCLPLLTKYYTAPGNMNASIGLDIQTLTPQYVGKNEAITAYYVPFSNRLYQVVNEFLDKAPKDKLVWYWITVPDPATLSGLDASCPRK